MQSNPWGPFGRMVGVCAVAVVATVALYGQAIERKVIKKVAPEYPAIMKQRHIHGVVKLNAVVKADGTVKDVVVLGGNPALVDASVRAVKQWKYAPFDRETTVDITIEFDPNSQ